MLSLCMALPALAQDNDHIPAYKDYKDPEQFEKFRRRRIVVGAWQINMLKEEGAIVVKLKTNKLLIDELRKSGNTGLALEKQLEQFAINRNTMFAYLENFTFCKVYFIYSSSSDSLLNGSRNGIFLDSNLVPDPSIVMNEKFYLIAERDFAYTSSIGFVKEDSARFIKETGNPIKQMAIVLKNKYGHQLKSPVPYAIKEKSFSATNYVMPISYRPAPEGATSVNFPVNRTYLADLKTTPSKKILTKTTEDRVYTQVKLKKEFTYEKQSLYVTQLNDELNQMYKDYPKPDPKRIRADIKPFLY